MTGARGARRVARLQTLWRGWGEIVRYELDGAAVPSVVVKRVHAPAGGDVGHRRKVRSYEVEAAFYRRYAPRAGGRTAKAWSIEPGCFVLEDLDASGFAERAVGTGSLDEGRIAACLAWLAQLHAAFLGEVPDGLWPIGTYWHLDTRPDELAAMPDGPLRRAASSLDRALCRVPQTVVHGDAKVANFCFGPSEVAAVDFQYAGGGCGLKDVSYFLGSCLDDGALEHEAEAWLDHYFRCLDRPDVEPAWRTIWPHAWADFERFLAGWSPGHWKRGRYADAMTRKALGSLGPRC